MTNSADPLAPADLPSSVWTAMLRGARGCCPRCAKAKIFGKWLKPLAQCPHCRLDLSEQRADDFPAYIAIFVTGHLLAPVLIAMVLELDLSAFAVLAIIVPLAVAMMLALLQPSKGAVIALQWWNGMHGFRKERRPDPVAADDGGPLN